jgi:hypothetical protein
MNGTAASTATIPLAGCTRGETDVFHEHWLSRDGELQTGSRRSIQTTSGRCGAFSYTCVLTVQMHFVNGEAEVRKDDFACSDSLGG